MKSRQSKLGLPYLHLSTARSGSAPIYKLLAYYFEKYEQLQPVEEILNPTFGQYHEVENRITYSVTQNTVSKLSAQKIRKQRFELVKKYHGRIFFKVFPSDFREPIAVHLCRDFRVITSERRDLFEQALSYLVSTSSDLWYKPGGLNIAPKSLKADSLMFAKFSRTILGYMQLKKVLKIEANLFYEDFLRLDAADLLKQAGLKKPISAKNIAFTEKQNKVSKISLFSNATEILAWYEDSFLQDLSPAPIHLLE